MGALTSGVATLATGILALIVATISPEAVGTLLTEAGPLGVAVYILYRRIEQLEERMREQDDRIDANTRHRRHAERIDPPER